MNAGKRRRRPQPALHPLKSTLDFSDPVRKLYLSVALMAAMFALGTVGYELLGQGEWSLLDCAYMTMITLATVGYG